MIVFRDGKFHYSLPELLPVVEWMSKNNNDWLEHEVRHSLLILL
jgi:hypothetical protein